MPARQRPHTKLGEIDAIVKRRNIRRGRTVGHMHAQVVDWLPVCKGLNERILPAIVPCVVLLQVMYGKKLTFALARAKQKT